MTTIHKIKWFALSAIILLFIITAFQNTGMTDVLFLGWHAEAPRLILISGVGLGGFLAGVLSVLLIQRRQCPQQPMRIASSNTDQIDAP